MIDNNYEELEYLPEDLPTWQEIYDIINTPRWANFSTTLPTEMDIQNPMVPKGIKNVILIANQINYMTIHKLLPQDIVINHKKYIQPIHIHGLKAIVNSKPIICVIGTNAWCNPKVTFKKYCPYMINYNASLELLIYSLDNGVPLTINPNDSYFQTIIRSIFKDVIDYFENGVGWKDENGNLIKSDDHYTGCNSGVDAAL